MKIALVVKEHVESKGGLERYAVNLSRSFARKGVEVHVYANRWDEEEGLIFHYVPYTRWNSILKVITFPRNLKKHLSRASFDLVYGLTPFYPLDIYRVGEGLHTDVLRERFPNPLRRFTRYLNPKHLLILRTERNLFKPENSRRIITNSKMVKKRLVERYEVAPERIRVIYNGCDQSRFNLASKVHRADIRLHHGISESEPLILFSGNDFKRKGLSHLLKALSVLKQKGTFVKLLVTGAGKAAPYKKMATKLGIKGQVLFAGSVSDMERYYGAADIFVLPTLYDPFSNVCLEAMASGLPVITTTKNGASEIITEGVDGFVIGDPLNTLILADRIETLFEMEGAGEAAAEKAAAYTIESNVSATLDLCNELTDSRKVVPLFGNGRTRR